MLLLISISKFALVRGFRINVFITVFISLAQKEHNYGPVRARHNWPRPIRGRDLYVLVRDETLIGLETEASRPRTWPPLLNCIPIITYKIESIIRFYRLYWSASYLHFYSPAFRTQPFANVSEHSEPLLPPVATWRQTSCHWYPIYTEAGETFSARHAADIEVKSAESCL